MKPIHVFKRACFFSPNQELQCRTRPDWFNKEMVFRNFLDTVNTDIADYTIIYDNHFGYEEVSLLNCKAKVIMIDGGYEAKSFTETLKIIESMHLPEDTIICLLEDDYLHVPGWCEVLLEAFTLPIHYATLYDHRDKYLDYPDLQSRIFVTKSCHWRTIPSTTNTFACKLSTLLEDLESQIAFSRDVGVTNDNEKFLNLGRRGRVLVSPMPSYSTHCVLRDLAPLRDWKKLIRRYLSILGHFQNDTTI